MELPASESASLVLALTAPSLLWLFLRFAESLWRQHKALKHHLKNALFSTDSNNKTSNSSSKAFAIHVLTGLPLVLTAPYLAYLMVPGVLMDNVDNGSAVNGFAVGFLKFLSTALIVVNSTVVFWIVPHPSRYQSYGVDQRAFVRGLAIMYVAGLQFTAMPLSCLIFLARNTTNNDMVDAAVPLVAAIMTPLLYWWTVLICASELYSSQFQWEHQFWARPILTHCMGHGLKQKSKLTAAFINADTPKKRAAQVVMFCIFGAVGVLASVQAVGFLTETVAGVATQRTTIGRAQELYFVVLSLYLTLIMSAGFFTMSQSIFDADLSAAAASSKQQEDKQKKNDDYNETTATQKVSSEPLLTMGEVKVLVETLLTQALPVALLVVGPEWVGMTSFADFVGPFLLWNPCVVAAASTSN
ncbi:expressed unknown protein [Seminavis robusta]|uniref:Uncharacterized protein n=1 Tax=Seminavis robusta TaxID=568900 RepID=A0A9N8H1T4_9STRA|nr:expressed unknown protein [Seminavis robusta]|eukprot:Sro48_g028280.1 n/a (414) ;mRNA; r:84970-86211